MTYKLSLLVGSDGQRDRAWGMFPPPQLLAQVCACVGVCVLLPVPEDSARAAELSLVLKSVHGSGARLWSVTFQPSACCLFVCPVGHRVIL